MVSMKNFTGSVLNVFAGVLLGLAIDRLDSPTSAFILFAIGFILLAVGLITTLID